MKVKLSQEDPPRKQDTDISEVEVVSSVSGKKEIPVLTVNSSEGEEEKHFFLYVHKTVKKKRIS